MRSAAIKRKEVWDSVQLTFNLDTINWRYRTREEGGGGCGGCGVDYPHCECMSLMAALIYGGCQIDMELNENQFMRATALTYYFSKPRPEMWT